MTDFSALSSRVHSLYQQGRDAWPDLQVTQSQFAERVLETLSPHVDPHKALDALLAADFFLVCACVEGEPKALEELDKLLLRSARRPMARVLESEAEVEDALQQLRRKLLSREDGAPRIAEYSGRGPLGAWIRATATRLAIDLRRVRRPEAEGSDEVLKLLGDPQDNPETRAVKGEHRAVFEAALRAALAKLESRERNALRLYALDGLSYDQIGKLYDVNRSTVSRWISGAREQVQRELRRTLADNLNLRGRELESFLGLHGDRLDASINSLLKLSRS